MINCIKKGLLWGFLIFIPTQLGKHFWPIWSYVLGIKVDYLSPTLYFLDLIWLGLFIFNFKILKLKKLFNFKTIILLLFIGLNILIAQNKGIAIYKWLRLFQFVWTIVFLRINKEELKRILIKVIPSWIIVESVLGLAQVIKGGSLNGLFYFLGERNFSFNTIGIAQISVIGQGLIRAYGTFSHPNSLAGFILISLILWVNFKAKINNRIWWWFVFWWGILAIIIGGSRLIWGLSLIVWILFFRNYFKDKKYIWGGIFLILGIFILVLRLISVNYPLNNFIGGFDNASFDKRWQLNIESVAMIKDSIWVGHGMGNFLSILPDYQKNSNYFWLQPVHNLGLLSLVELGILGIALLVWNTFEYWKKIKLNKVEIVLIFCILITGMWDHYWITLPQNWWLLGVVLAII